MRPKSTDCTSREFFDAKYRSQIDPWSFSSSSYEQSRYQVLLHALEGRRFHCAFEPGCSIGVFTAHLASLCDRVEAIDISPTAVARAKLRCAHHPHVTVSCGSIPDAIPDCSFDLIVLSEFGYYLTQIQLVALIRKLRQKLSLPGTLLVSHWLGYSEDHLVTGDQVHEIVGTVMAVPPDLSERHPSFRLDRWKLDA